MAKIKLGALAQDVRGSLNGTTFSRNRGGAFVRSKVSPVQPVSPYSARARAIFKALAQAWSATLTDMQRQAWESFAAVHPFVNVFGDALILSGIAMFESLNRRLGQVGEDVLAEPPVTFVVEDLAGVAVVISGDGSNVPTLTLTPGRALTGDEGLYVFATPPLLGARQPQRNDYRLINTPEGGTIASGADCGPALGTRFGEVTWAVGQRVSLRVAALNKTTGAMSAAVTLNVVVAADGGSA